MVIEGDRNLRSEIRKHLDYLVSEIGARPVGSIENARAYKYLADYIQNLGLHPYSHETTTMFRRPTSWLCTLHSNEATEMLSILPGFATLGTRHLHMQVMPYIYETKEDFERHPPSQGSLVLVSLGNLHEADACRLAGRAAAVGWFRKGHQGLYSGNCTRNQQEPLVPGFAILYKDLQRILTPGISLSLTIKAENQLMSIRNLIVDIGNITDHPCFITHYDSRAFSPGANDNASGVACLLGILSIWPRDKPARFIFFDAEEVGSFGSREYVHWLQSEQAVDRISYVINPDSVGLGELHLYTGDRYGPLSDKLIAHARQAFQKYAWNVPERVARSGTSDYIYFRQAGIPCLFLSDFPNELRHTTEDSLANINTEVLVQLSKVLAQEDFHSDISK